MSTSVDPRTPVIVGAGQFTFHADDVASGKEPAELMELAARGAAEHAGLADVPAVDSVRVVRSLSWRYRNTPRVVADRLGLTPRQYAETTDGGNSPQTLVNTTARQIAAGELDAALLVGGEAFRTRMRAGREGVHLTWPKLPDDDRPEIIGPDFVMSSDVEREVGLEEPAQVYPMFETAIRAAAGHDPDEHLRMISELWSRFSRVAATNPYAFLPVARSPEEIRTPTPRNRVIGFPYTKYMNSNSDVDMAAAVVMCSAATAERWGVDRDRWVFPVAGTDCHEHVHISHRDTYARTPAIEIGGRRVLELAGTTIDEVDLIDLYSCFPSAVQLGASSLGLDPYDPERRLTRTGGLPFMGGPWNDYPMHAIATIVDELRRGVGSTGLVWANGGYVTKHAFGVYRTEPPPHGYRHDAPQAEIDALPRRELADGHDASGPATIEAYVVPHDRDGVATRVAAACLLPDGRRAWGVNEDPSVAAAMTDGEWVGRAVELTSDRTMHPG